MGRFGQRHRQRSRPKPRRDTARRVRDIVAERVEHRNIRDVRDERIVLRPALGRKNAARRVRVEGVCAQAVHRLRRERDEPTGTDDRARLFDFVYRIDDRFHM